MARGQVGSIQGLREARETLADLSKAMQRGVGKRALKNGPGAVFANAIKARAKVSGRGNDPTPGSLKASVKVVDDRPHKGAPRVAVLVDDIAAVPKEFGLRSRNYRAEPFARPAIDTHREIAAAAMAEELKIEVDAAAARIAKQSKV